ncbi:MAG: hypothetical protein A4E57_00227 [Syntrophorhabdaceae bacterium PtaU1.Bin034]|nr:MAG: hypothetical protein A4E57_00227 [Syntrophorhabdaceae bacterium PtaU1.Bin034]
MEREQIIERIKSESKNGKLSCPRALAMARELGISPKELGDLLNELRIKIAGCQLGCFP